MKRKHNVLSVAATLVLALAAVVSQVASAQELGPADDTPGALGHSLSTQHFQFLSYTSDTEGRAEFPVAGRIKIADNNSPIPRDRVYFMFSHFHNALETTVVDLVQSRTTTRTGSIERYTVGMEKTLWDEHFSVELRMPLFRPPSDVVNPNLTPGSYAVGDLSIINKWLIAKSRTSALSTGLAVTVPTGDDARFNVDQEIFNLNNNAVHLTPFVGWLGAPTERFFYQAFGEVDFPLWGNTVEFRTLGLGNGGIPLGSLTPQTVFCTDVSCGYWLYRNGSPDGSAGNATGLATILEFSYLTALNDADTFSGTTFTGNTDYYFGNVRNRFDVVVTTIGLHAEISGQTTVRMGAVLPITDGDDRFFDAEILFQLNRRF